MAVRLSIALNRLGRYDEAIKLADQIEHTCGDRLGAECLRAEVLLNRGAWEEAAKAARYVRNLWTETSFIAAIAAFEMGRMEESAADFLHGACNHPGAVPLITGRRAKAPETADEALDQRTVADLLQNLPIYLAQNGSRARRFFGSLAANSNFVALMAEIDEKRRSRDEERRTSFRVECKQLQRMESPKFAAERAAEIYSLLRPGKAAKLKTQAR